MYTNKIQPISLKGSLQRRLIPLKEYKGPFLELRFWEQEEVDILNKQLSCLENEAEDIIRTMNINQHLTGYQKNKCHYKLMNIETSINAVKNKIFSIKKERYLKQLADNSKL